MANNISIFTNGIPVHKNDIAKIYDPSKNRYLSPDEIPGVRGDVILLPRHSVPLNKYGNHVDIVGYGKRDPITKVWNFSYKDSSVEISTELEINQSTGKLFICAATGDVYILPIKFPSYVVAIGRLNTIYIYDNPVASTKNGWRYKINLIGYKIEEKDITVHPSEMEFTPLEFMINKKPNSNLSLLEDTTAMLCKSGEVIYPNLRNPKVSSPVDVRHPKGAEKIFVHSRFMVKEGTYYVKGYNFIHKINVVFRKTPNSEIIINGIDDFSPNKRIIHRKIHLQASINNVIIQVTFVNIDTSDLLPINMRFLISDLLSLIDNDITVPSAITINVDRNIVGNDDLMKSIFSINVKKDDSRFDDEVNYNIVRNRDKTVFVTNSPTLGILRIKWALNRVIMKDHYPSKKIISYERRDSNGQWKNVNLEMSVFDDPIAKFINGNMISLIE